MSGHCVNANVNHSAHSILIKKLNLGGWGGVSLKRKEKTEIKSKAHWKADENRKMQSVCVSMFLTVHFALDRNEGSDSLCVVEKEPATRGLGVPVDKGTQRVLD